MSRIFPIAALLLTAGLAHADDGEELFRQKCVACHSVARVMKRQEALSPEALQSQLERFLPGHFTPDAAERAAMIDYLVALKSGGSK